MNKIIAALLISCAPSLVLAQNCYEPTENVLLSESVHFLESEERYTLDIISGDTIDLVAYKVGSCNEILEYVSDFTEEDENNIKLINENEKITVSIEKTKEGEKIIQEIRMYSTGDKLLIDAVKTLTEKNANEIALKTIFEKNNLVSEEIILNKKDKRWSVWTYDNFVIGNEKVPSLNMQYFKRVPIKLDVCSNHLSNIKKCTP